MNKLVCLFALLFAFLPTAVLAGHEGLGNFHLVESSTGIFCLVVFAIAYLLVTLEEHLDLKKSKPVLFAAGVIWFAIAWHIQSHGLGHDVHAAAQRNLLEYAELFLFLLVAMTYVNALEERQVFEALCAKLIQRNFSLRQLFWVTGFLAFLISPVADNLTTALLMCAIVLTLSDDRRYLNLCCINIVVGANAGGAFSPFGDITTLMVWQDKHLAFYDFFHIFIPALLNFLVPAICMHFAIPKGTPNASSKSVTLKPGAMVVLFLFLMTIITAVVFHNVLDLPAAMGMVTGLSYLQIFSYYLKKRGSSTTLHEFNVFKKIQRAEWDTLLFFYGIILCVGGLASLGYLEVIGNLLYNSWGVGLDPAHHQTPANIAVGFISSIIDNIPVMFAVLTIHPQMSEGQWLLVTLTAGVGGSLLSVGSAAGVALMGQAKGAYTFMSHLKWSWAVLLGYVVSILAHFWLNGALFT